MEKLGAEVAGWTQGFVDQAVVHRVCAVSDAAQCSLCGHYKLMEGSVTNREQWPSGSAHREKRKSLIEICPSPHAQRWKEEDPRKNYSEKEPSMKQSENKVVKCSRSQVNMPSQKEGSDELCHR